MNVLKLLKNNYKIILASVLLYHICIVLGFCMYLAVAPNISATVLDIAVVNNTKIYFINVSSNLTSILCNNIILIIQLIGGSILFGIPTFCLLIYNGITFGIILASTVESKTALSKIFLLTIPHGIFEIPAIIIAGAAGFKVPYEIIRYLAGRKEQILTKEDIKEYLTMALISIILIIIAAWIEANITLKIAKEMLNSTKGV